MRRPEERPKSCDTLVPVPARHDAFISYSHAADRALATRFEHGMEQLAKPLLRLRAMDVFRDETSLSASPGVWPAIEAHLASAEWLVLFACPESARSPWCVRELLWWLEHRPHERLLMVLTGGALAWDAAAGDFDWPRSTAPPTVLAGKLADEPLYVDLAWAREADGLSLAHPRFREAVVAIAAPVRGIERDALDGADIRQHARDRWIMRAGVTAISAAAALAVWQAVVANRERATAEAERAVAVQQRAVADQQRARAEKALAATQRELLRAQSAELRGLLQRVDGLQAVRAAGPAAERLQRERSALAARLDATTRRHQQLLAAEIGFRGDFEFLQRWEGNLGGVRLVGDEAMIDPQIDLGRARAELIRQRYEFVLTPDELDGVLALVGQRGDAARAAWKAHPALCRIRLQATDVARLVPEVAGEFWLRLVARYPAVRDGAGTSPALHTALLSLAFNAGVNKRLFDPVIAAMAQPDRGRVADAIEHAQDDNPLLARFPGLKRRRTAEANLVRAEAGLAVPTPVAVPPAGAVTLRPGPGC